MSIDTLATWNAVAKTDPKFTKQVNMGRRFTSIDGQYVIKRMTEVCGQIGEGWTWHAEHSVLEMKERTLAVCDVTVTVSGDPSICKWGPVRAMNELINSKGRFDEDAPKKAMTDALTKALSHIGIAADVRLGMFDDNKYVEAMRREHAQQQSAPVPHGSIPIPPDDPQASQPVIETLTEEQVKTISDMAFQASTDLSRIAQAFGVEQVQDIPSDQYGRVINGLKRKLAA